MCGRYIIRQLAAAEQEFKLARVSFGLADRYNVAPTQPVPIVRVAYGLTEGLDMRWGLIPFFARGEPPRYSTINARIETLDSAASYREAWSRGQRCLQLASGFYEWHVDPHGRKAPCFIRLADRELFAFAALWERSFSGDGTRIESCALVTLPANALLYEIHNSGSHPHRMPAILRSKDHEAWLSGTAAEARAVLEPYPAEQMIAYEVSLRVNSPQTDDPQLIEPVTDTR
jgi:putative SOS response-associated peptidase YedK